MRFGKIHKKPISLLPLAIFNDAAGRIVLSDDTGSGSLPAVAQKHKIKPAVPAARPGPRPRNAPSLTRSTAPLGAPKISPNFPHVSAPTVQLRYPTPSGRSPSPLLRRPKAEGPGSHPTTSAMRQAARAHRTAGLIIRPPTLNPLQGFGARAQRRRPSDGFDGLLSAP
jgi:hypothetical protein